MTSTQYIKAYSALLIGILSVSLSAIFVRLTHAPAGITAFYRLFFTVILMAPLFPRYVSSFKNISFKTWVLCALGGISLAFHFILWFRSLELTSVASSVVLVTLQPLFAFFGTTLLFKEKYSFGAIFGAFFSILGSLLISWGDFKLGSTALIGDGFALLACVAVTVYLMIGQRVRQNMPLFSYTFIVYFFSTLTLFIYNLLTSQAFFGYGRADWILFALLAVFPTLLGHTLFNWVIKWMGVTTVSMSILGEPIGASILAYMLFGENLRPLQILGSLIIISGVGLYLIFERQRHEHLKKQNQSLLPPKVKKRAG